MMKSSKGWKTIEMTKLIKLNQSKSSKTSQIEIEKMKLT